MPPASKRQRDYGKICAKTAYIDLAKLLGRCRHLRAHVLPPPTWCLGSIWAWRSYIRFLSIARFSNRAIWSKASNGISDIAITCFQRAVLQSRNSSNTGLIRTSCPEFTSTWSSSTAPEVISIQNTTLHGDRASATCMLIFISSLLNIILEVWIDDRTFIQILSEHRSIESQTLIFF